MTQRLREAKQHAMNTKPMTINMGKIVDTQQQSMAIMRIMITMATNTTLTMAIGTTARDKSKTFLYSKKDYAHLA